MGLEEIVNKLNENLPDDSMFCFTLLSNTFWDSICLCYMGITITIWDSENGPSDPTYHDVLGEFQKIVLELFKISQIGKVIEKSLSRTYTDFLMLEDESWKPDKSSIDSSIGNLQEVAEDILELELKDTRDE